MGSLGYTWAPKGQQPTVQTNGRRKGYKVFGLIEHFSGRFFWQGQIERFNVDSYIAFLRTVLAQNRQARDFDLGWRRIPYVSGHAAVLRRPRRTLDRVSTARLLAGLQSHRVSVAQCQKTGPPVRQGGHSPQVLPLLRGPDRKGRDDAARGGATARPHSGPNGSLSRIPRGSCLSGFTPNLYLNYYSPTHVQ